MIKATGLSGSYATESRRDHFLRSEIAVRAVNRGWPAGMLQTG